MAGIAAPAVEGWPDGLEHQKRASGPPRRAATPPSKLRYIPALDGLRGLAVAAVLLFHGGFGWATGGFLGVSLFFTLSGFLITSLVVSERASTGGVDVLAFWARRARRLLPASLLTLLLTVYVTWIAVPLAQRPSVLGDVRAALFNVANWRFISQGAPYADPGLVPSPVQHYWSLAIEEQFYLAFPLLAIVALRWRPKVLGCVFGAVIALSVLAQLSFDGTDRIYFGTDTRAAELAIGGLLALGLPHVAAVQRRTSARLADAMGAATLLATLVLWWRADLQDPGLYAGALAVVGVVSATVIYGSVEGRVLARVLSARPLVELGKISYGVYLYHLPLFLLLTEDRVHRSGAALFILRALATVLLATASFHLVERPIRLGRSLARGRALPALAGAVAAIALVTVPLSTRAEDQQLAAGIGGSTANIVPSVPVTQPPGVGPAEAPSPSDGPPVTQPPGRDDTGAPAPPSDHPGAEDPTPLRPPRIVVVGDSTAAANGTGLQQWGLRTGKLEVVTVSSPGCATFSGERFKVREGYEFTPENCDSLYATAAEQAEALRADAVVVFVGSSQLADWRFPLLDGWRHIGEPEVDAGYVPALQRALTTLGRAGRPILWADVPTPDWDLEVFGQMMGEPLPGSGPVTLNDPARAERLNLLDIATVSAHPLAQVWDYRAHLAGPDGEVPRDIRPDGLHVSVSGMARIADAWLYDLLGETYGEIIARPGTGLTGAEPNAWSG